MRFTPRSTFLSVVALGLPFAVTIGWTLGTPAPPPVSAPGGAGGIGPAPTKATTPATMSVLDWSPRPPKPVAVESSVPGRSGSPAVSTSPSSTAPPTVIVPSSSPAPTLSPLVPPVPTPTSVVTTPPSPSATASWISEEPENPFFGSPRRWRRF